MSLLTTNSDALPPSNQVFPAVSLLTTNNHALPPYNQNSSSSFIAHEPFGLNPQLSQVEDDMFWVGNL
ncbi:hypothetical protein ACFX1R_019994 [Malus domestica]